MKKSEYEFLKIFSDNIEMPSSFDSLRDKINLERFEKNKDNNQTILNKIIIGFCSFAIFLVAGGVIINVNNQNEWNYGNNVSNVVLVPPWNEKSIVQKYPSFIYSDIEYTIFSTSIKEGINIKYVGNKIDNIIVKGYDIYDDSDYYINAEIFEINNVYNECAYAIKFEGDNDYYSYLNTLYEFETLGDFITKLNLKEYLKFGKAYKGNIEYNDFNDSIVWDMLLYDHSLVNANLTNNHYKNSLMSISSNIEALGIKNVSMAVNDDGYVQTNILGIAKTFYIGKEKVNAFVDYIINNVQKK